MIRSWAYNRFGVLMGTSSRASCPRWPSLRGNSWPMITLFSSQGDFCATAFFAFKEGMWDTQIWALLSSPTVSQRFLRQVFYTCVGACGNSSLLSTRCTLFLARVLAYALGWHSERTRISSCIQSGLLMKFARLQ